MTKPARILIVESDQNVRTMMELAFSYSGGSYQVYTAPSGRSALLQFGIVRPDIVLLNIDMPDEDGWEMLARIRELSTVPVIALCDTDRSETQIRCLEAGADYCLTKPFGLREIHARVRALLRRENKASRVPPWAIPRPGSDGRTVEGTPTVADGTSGARAASELPQSRPSYGILSGGGTSLSSVPVLHVHAYPQARSGEAGHQAFAVPAAD